MVEKSELVKDAEWLKSKLIELLEDASMQSPKDHSACAKYADLLFKVLPKGVEKASPSVVEVVRKRLMSSD